MLFHSRRARLGRFAGFWPAKYDTPHVFHLPATQPMLRIEGVNPNPEPLRSALARKARTVLRYPLSLTVDDVGIAGGTAKCSLIDLHSRSGTVREPTTSARRLAATPDGIESKETGLAWIDRAPKGSAGRSWSAPLYRRCRRPSAPGRKDVPLRGLQTRSGPNSCAEQPEGPSTDAQIDKELQPEQKKPRRVNPPGPKTGWPGRFAKEPSGPYPQSSAHQPADCGKAEAMTADSGVPSAPARRKPRQGKPAPAVGAPKVDSLSSIHRAAHNTPNLAAVN